MRQMAHCAHAAVYNLLLGRMQLVSAAVYNLLLGRMQLMLLGRMLLFMPESCLSQLWEIPCLHRTLMC